VLIVVHSLVNTKGKPMSNLVELMAKVLDKYPVAKYFPDHYTKGMARDMLSVVKEHIGEVAELCPVCLGTQFQPEEVVDYPCKTCKGLGLSPEPKETYEER